MTHEEFRFAAKDMKMILDPRMAFIAEVDGKPAGFMLAIPDLKCRNPFRKFHPDGYFPPESLNFYFAENQSTRCVLFFWELNRNIRGAEFLRSLPLKLSNGPANMAIALEKHSRCRRRQCGHE